MSSSCQPWPEAWIGASAAVTTSAPISKIRSIVSFTERSLPGIGLAEKTTVSPECSSMSRWSLNAIRRSAESGSPWLPVEIAITLWSGKSSISFGWIRSPSGARAIPRFEAMLKFLRIDRPTSATRLSSSAAASIACWTRCTLEAKQVTMIRPSQREKVSSSAGPTDDSEGATPGRSALVESPNRHSRPSRPSSASRETSAATPSTGVWSNL